MSKEQVLEAVKVLRSGGVILYQSDTIWGIGCDARNSEAVKKVFEIKKRKESKSLITLLGDELELQSYIREVPEVAWDLIEFSESPLTIVYDDVRNLAKEVLAEDGSAGIRIAKKDSACNNLLRAFRGPLVSTSANISGVDFSGQFEDVSQEVIDSVDFVLESSAKAEVKASKIIKLGVNGDYKLIRA